MAENKRYFWLRLYDDFFTSKRIKKLRALAGGDTYTIIYLKMQLKAIKDDGYLYFDNIMKDFAEELALDIDETPDDVRVTIQYLLSVGLLECSEDGEQYFLTYLPNLIGSETASAQRVRDYRKRKKEESALLCNNGVTDVLRTGNAEIEKRIDREEKEKENSTSKEIRHKYGEYNHVLLTDDQYKRLCDDYGEEATKQAIKKVDEYCQQYGKSYKDYNLTLRKWGYDGIKTKKTSGNSDLDEWAARKEREQNERK